MNGAIFSISDKHCERYQQTVLLFLKYSCSVNILKQTTPPSVRYKKIDKAVLAILLHLHQTARRILIELNLSGGRVQDILVWFTFLVAPVRLQAGEGGKSLAELLRN
jgi:hypothetical protein